MRRSIRFWQGAALGVPYLTAYRALVQGLSNGRVIDATQPPEKVGADISRAILDFMAERMAKRSGNKSP